MGKIRGVIDPKNWTPWKERGRIKRSSPDGLTAPALADSSAPWNYRLFCSGAKINKVTRKHRCLHQAISLVSNYKGISLSERREGCHYLILTMQEEELRES